MRTLRRNKVKMKYSLKGERKPIYVLDENGNKIIDFIDSEGNVYYKETGSYTNGWSEPIDFYGNIAMSGGESEAQEFGLSISDYDAVLITDKGQVPLVENSRIWLNNAVKYEDDEKVNIDETSANFVVRRVAESINGVKYVLQAVV